jgi:hypothetical protein
VQAALAHRLLAADGVGVERVATVDDDVAGFHGIGELVDHRVRGIAGLDHDDHPPRLLQRVQEFLDALRTDELAFVTVLFEQGIGLGDRSIVQSHRVAVVREIASEVRTHHRQAGDTDLRGPGCRSLGILGTHVFASQFGESSPIQKQARPLWHSGLVVRQGVRLPYRLNSRRSSVSHGTASATVGTTNTATAAR